MPSQAGPESLAAVDYVPFLTRSVCGPRECPLFDDDGLLAYRDGDHLTAPFARRLVPEFRAALRPVLASNDAESADNAAPASPGR